MQSKKHSEPTLERQASPCRNYSCMQRDQIGRFLKILGNMPFKSCRFFVTFWAVWKNNFCSKNHFVYIWAAFEEFWTIFNVNFWSHWLYTYIWGECLKWICLQIPSCHLRFESRAHTIKPFIVHCQICDRYICLWVGKRTKINKNGPFITIRCKQWSENTHCRGKHHCTAGLQFFKVALDCFTKYK